MDVIYATQRWPLFPKRHKKNTILLYQHDHVTMSYLLILSSWCTRHLLTKAVCNKHFLSTHPVSLIRSPPSRGINDFLRKGVVFVVGFLWPRDSQFTAINHVGYRDTGAKQNYGVGNNPPWPTWELRICIYFLDVWRWII